MIHDDEPRLMRVLNGEVLSPPPIWMMRQAGRYLPEYRAIRKNAGSFLDLCYNPNLATEVTLQPIRRFGFDAAILFSDILVVPHALGQNVRFVENEGPCLESVDNIEKMNRLRSVHDPVIFHHLEPVLETVSRLRGKLPRETALIGFCGAPWTVACYMINGKGISDFQPILNVIKSNESLVDRVIEILIAVEVEYLVKQLRSGADVVQIFESHAESLINLGSKLLHSKATIGKGEEDFFLRWSLIPIAKIISGVRMQIPSAKIIVFARGSGLFGHSRVVSQTHASAVGVDWAIDLKSLRNIVSRQTVTQGNLDPRVLVEGGHKLDAAVDDVCAAVEGLPHVFNLGHGITPDTPVRHVEQMLKRLRR